MIGTYLFFHYFSCKIGLPELDETIYFWGAAAINCVVILVLITGTLYSLILLPYVIVNLFSLGQITNLQATIESIKEEKSATFNSE